MQYVIVILMLMLKAMMFVMSLIIKLMFKDETKRLESKVKYIKGVH